MNEDYHKEQEPVKEPTIPEEYQKYTSVFSEEESKQFPPNREPNATIQLKEGAPMEINCKVYPLTRQETQTLKEFIEKELEKGYISEAASPYTSPVFFIAKKNTSEKQLVIDYRKLNEWTISNNGPLASIETLMQQLEGKDLFSKFNI